MTIVLCNGVFDIWHYGHLRHLQAARAYGTWLAVAITRDSHVNKGPWRPVFDDLKRREVVAEQRCVDQTILVADVIEALELVQPDVFVKGAEYRGKIEPKHYEYCKAHKIRIEFTDEITYSSTELLTYYDHPRQS